MTKRIEQPSQPTKASTSDEIVVSLNAPDELFSIGVPDMFSSAGRLLSGMDELVRELTPQRLRPGLRATIVLPPEEVRPDTEQRIRQAIDRYCRLRLEHTEAARRTRRRDVVSAFAIGLVLFAVGIALSSYVAQSNAPALLKSFLADGLFLVTAWVGLWYPLDELVHYGRPLNREKRVLAAIRAMHVSVRGEQRSQDDLSC